MIFFKIKIITGSLLAIISEKIYQGTKKSDCNSPPEPHILPLQVDACLIIYSRRWLNCSCERGPFAEQHCQWVPAET